MTIMLGSDFYGSGPNPPARRDSIDSQPDSRRGSMDDHVPPPSAPSSSSSSPSEGAARNQRLQRLQQQRGRFWGAAQVDCTSAPFSA